MNARTEQNQPLISPPLFKWAGIGALIALTLISLFLLSAKDPDPNWPKLWRLRPLIIVPLAGAAGGAFFHFMNYITKRGTWQKVLAITFGVIVFIIGLWMGIILGLDGTYWN